MNSPLNTLMKNPPLRGTMGNRPHKSLFYDSKKEAARRPKTSPLLTALGNVRDRELGMHSNHFWDWVVHDKTNPNSDSYDPRIKGDLKAISKCLLEDHLAWARAGCPKEQTSLLLEWETSGFPTFGADGKPLTN